MEIGVLALVKALLEWKYVAVMLVFFLDGTISPIPGEVVLILAGYLLYLGQLNFLLVTLSATLGSVLASVLWYELSRRYGERVFRKYGKYVMLSKENLAKSDAWFKRYGDRAVFIGRLLPVVNQLISIPAGVAKMERVKFLLYTTLGFFVWYAAVTGLAWYLGSKWDLLLLYLQPLQLALLILVACVAVAIILRKLFGRYIDRVAKALHL